MNIKYKHYRYFELYIACIRNIQGTFLDAKKHVLNDNSPSNIAKTYFIVSSIAFVSNMF